MHLADSSIWLLIACMMATLNIEKSVDENGKVIEPVYTLDNAIFRLVQVISPKICKPYLTSPRTPSPFKCDIRPRSEKALMLIKQSEVI